jgi:hypothetical protein
MFTCTSKVHHGDCRLTATGTGETRQEALLAAVKATVIGYVPSKTNTAGAVELVTRWEQGERPASGYLHSKTGWAYLRDDPEGPRIQIGWVDFTFTAQVVRLWAVTSQVEVKRNDGWGRSRQVPTVDLDPTVQGIVSAEGAKRVAEDILETAGPVDGKGVTLHVTVEPVY